MGQPLSAVATLHGDRVCITDMDLAIYIRMRQNQGGHLEVYEVEDVARNRTNFYFKLNSSARSSGADLMDSLRGLERDFVNSPEAIHYAAARRDLQRFKRRVR